MWKQMNFPDGCLHPITAKSGENDARAPFSRLRLNVASAITSVHVAVLYFHTNAKQAGVREFLLCAKSYFSLSTRGIPCRMVLQRINFILPALVRIN